MSSRMSAADRRVEILDAAVVEFGRTGMHATSTEVIAARAGISQPYLFRLFGTKAELMAAAIEHHTANLLEVLRAAVRDRTGDTTPLAAMGVAYLALLEGDPQNLRHQLHAWAAASDPDIRGVAQHTYRAVWDEVAELSGASPEEVRAFMSYGMLMTVLGALDLPDLLGNPLQTLQEL